MKGGPFPFAACFGLGFLAGLLARDSLPCRTGVLDSSGSWLRASQATHLPAISASLTDPPAPASAAVTALTHRPKPASAATTALTDPPEPASAATTALADPRKEKLCRVAREAAIKSQVLLLLGDRNMFARPGDNNTLIAKMLHSLMALRVNNVLLVALDPQAYKQGRAWVKYARTHISLHVTQREIPTPGALAQMSITHQQSAKKFEVLQDLLACGVHALLSDFDVIFWDDPFKHLVGDADVEAMSDGFDYNGRYGYAIDTCCPPPPLYHWASAWEWRVVFLNSGFFYIRASRQTVETMAATWRMLTLEQIWDQTAFNAQIRAPLGTPTSGRLHGQGLRIRVMDLYNFPNSRVMNELVAPKTASSLFDPKPQFRVPPFRWPTPHGRPVAVHMNYHQHKVAMMAWAWKVFGRAGGAREESEEP